MKKKGERANAHLQSEFRKVFRAINLGGVQGQNLAGDHPFPAVLRVGVLVTLFGLRGEMRHPTTSLPGLHAAPYEAYEK